MSQRLLAQSISLNPFSYQSAEGVTPENFDVYNTPSMWFGSNPAYPAKNYLFSEEANLLHLEKNPALIEINRFISWMNWDINNNGGGNEIRWKNFEEFNENVDKAGFPESEAKNLKNLYKKVNSFLTPSCWPRKNKESELSYYLEILLTNMTYFVANLTKEYLPEGINLLENPPAAEGAA